MERSVPLRFSVAGPVLSSRASSTCGACGEEFEQPLLAMVFSDSLVEEYYACPNCLSKVATIGRQKASEVAEAEAEEVEAPMAVEAEEVAIDVGEAAGCTHHLGYLKHRAKNEPLPEECLTCSKMIECMY